jgi:tRNA-dihydrouridine synthase
MQDAGVSALAIHGRTRDQLYTGEANWSMIGEVKNCQRIHIPIIGNGDISGPEKAKSSLEKSGVDGLMIGRGAIGRPWIFNEIKHYFKTGELLPPPLVSEVIGHVREHLDLSVESRGNVLSGILMMRRHFAKYFPALPSFREYRIRLLQAETLESVQEVLNQIEELYGGVRVDYENVSLK